MIFWIYPISVLCSFISVFLKGFQHKNVIGNYVKTVFFTSYAMALFDVISVTLIVKGGLWIALTSGTGAAFGMVVAIKFHDWLFGKNNESDILRFRRSFK